MSELLAIILPQAVPFMLVLTRFTGLFFFAPMLTSATIPVRAKAVMAASMALVVFPAVSHDLPTPLVLDLWVLAPMMAMELAVGAALGLLASVPVLAAQAAGHVMSYQMGLAIAQVYNPEVDAQSDALGELIFYLTFSAFVALGGLETLFLALTQSFATIPLSGFGPSITPLDLYTSLITSGFDLMLRISAPATAAVMLLMLAMGFLMKTMPQLNVLSVGFAIKILGGLLAATMALTIIDTAASDEIRSALDAMLAWVLHPQPVTEGG